MCGIVGYIGPKQAAPLILEALRKLEYRGYDSSGIAIADGNKLSVVKAKGRLSVLEEMTDGGRALPGCLGIGHTRWATHGEPNDVNAHPHLSQHGDVALVHNGIVENYIELRDFLTEQGYSFMSETDTEIAANLVEHLYRSNREDGPEAAIREALSLISGAFALGTAFGYADTVASGLPYQAMTRDDWCMDVPASPYYNRIVDARQVGAAAVAGSSEPMRLDLHRNGNPSYRLGFVIEHNPGNVPQGGSCIFAHLWRAPGEPTAGCTAMADADMEAMLEWLDAD